MLRSFQYTEKSYLSMSMHNTLYQEKEVELVHRFVLSNERSMNMESMCPICNSVHSSYFYTKWDVDYLRCDECGTVYAKCDYGVVNEFKHNSEINGFRKQSDYQVQITEKRQDVWVDFIEWMSIRCFRFLGKNKNLKIVDYGNRLLGLTRCISAHDICSEYNLRDSILKESEYSIDKGSADVVLYLDQIKTNMAPSKTINGIVQDLCDNGLLILSARAGSGFDVLILKDQNSRIYPYEHILLPSVRGLKLLLEENGLEVLEITTPGVMDVKYVMECMDKLDDRECFIRYMLNEASEKTIQEFQRFLQKGCFSSYVRIIARKKAQKNENI